MAIENYLQAMGGVGNLIDPFSAMQSGIQARQQNQQNDNVLAQQQAAAQQQQVASQQQAEQYQAAQAQQQSLQNDTQGFLDNPSPQNYAALVARHPEHAAAFQQAHNAFDAQTQSQNLNDLSGIISATSNGRPELAQKIIAQRIDAYKSSGQEVPQSVQQLSDAIESGDMSRTKGIASLMLGALQGPEGLYKAANPNGGPEKPTYHTLKDGNGVEHLVQVGGNQGGAPASDPATLTDRIIKAESGGNPNAPNPRSSASGPGQFLDKTFIEMFRQEYPNAATSDAAILKQKNNPALNKQLVAANSQKNTDYLAGQGLPIDDGSVYLAHFAGPAGAAKILRADPNAPVADYVPPAFIKANPEVLGRGQSVGDVRQWAASRVAAPTQQGANVREISVPGMASVPTNKQKALANQYGNAPNGYDWRPGGQLEFIKGGPADPSTSRGGTRPVPSGPMTAYLGNQAGLGKIDAAIAALEKAPDSVGFVKGMTPNVILSRTDPNGVTARAKIASIASQKFHDISGAAVTASESERLLPYVPTVTDSSSTVLKKLKNLRLEYMMVNDQVSAAYSQEQGYEALPEYKVFVPPINGGPQTTNTNATPKHIQDLIDKHKAKS